MGSVHVRPADVRKEITSALDAVERSLAISKQIVNSGQILTFWSAKDGE